MKIDLVGNKLTITFDVDEMKVVNYITTKHGLNWFSRLFSLEFERRKKQAVRDQKDLIWEKLQQRPDILSQLLDAK